MRGKPDQACLQDSAESYALHLNNVSDNVHVAVSGQYETMSQPSLDYDGSTAVKTTFGTRTFTVSLPQGSSGSIPVAVEWHFSGSIGGVELDVLECGGTINVTR